MIEIAYSGFVNRSTWLSPFQAIHRYLPCLHIDLLPTDAYPADPSETFAQHIRDVHTEIHR